MKDKKVNLFGRRCLFCDQDCIAQISRDKLVVYCEKHEELKEEFISNDKEEEGEEK